LPYSFSSALFPYATLFRSNDRLVCCRDGRINYWRDPGFNCGRSSSKPEASRTIDYDFFFNFCYCRSDIINYDSKNRTEAFDLNVLIVFFPGKYRNDIQPYLQYSFYRPDHFGFERLITHYSLSRYGTEDCRTKISRTRHWDCIYGSQWINRIRGAGRVDARRGF